jgi:hypothetical protein
MAVFWWLWGVWQHEIMMMPYMAERWNTKFVFFWGIWVPWGAAYDFTLLLQGFCIVVIFLAVWYWKD